MAEWKKKPLSHHILRVLLGIEKLMQGKTNLDVKRERIIKHPPYGKPSRRYTGRDDPLNIKSKITTEKELQNIVDAVMYDQGHTRIHKDPLTGESRFIERIY